MGFPENLPDSSLKLGWSEIFDASEDALDQINDLLELKFPNHPDTPRETYLAKTADIQSHSNVKNLRNLIDFGREEKLSLGEIKKDLSEGKIGIFHVVNTEKKGETKILAPPDLKKHVEGCSVNLHKRNKKGEKTVVSISKNDYELEAFTPEQYAKISQAAFRAFDNLDDLYKNHKKKNEEEKNISINVRNFSIKQDTHYEHIKDKFPNNIELLANNKKRQASEKEQHLEILTWENRLSNKEQTKALDKKASDKRKFYHEQDEHKDKLKTERKNQKRKIENDL